MTSKKKSNVLIRLVPLFFVAIVIIFFFALGLDRYLSFDALRQHQQQLTEYVDRRPFFASGFFILVYACSVAASLPGAAVLSITGGFLFGLVVGSICVVFGATIGACIVFLIARTALGDSLHDRAGPWLERMERGFNENGVSYLLFLRLVPIFPFWLVNLVPAFLGMRFAMFAAATFLGIVPGAIVYTSVGNGLGALIDEGQNPDLSIIFRPQILLPILGLAILALLPAIYQRFRKSSTSEDLGPS